MQTKGSVLLWALAIFLLVGLLFHTFMVKSMDYGELLLIEPITGTSSEINSEELEEINGESFLLTYEILTDGRISALHANYDATVKETNYTYHYIMNHNILNGSFFTKENQDKKQKSAVLNETAANQFFGNIDVCGTEILIGKEKFTVVGVMDDHDEDRSNIYIPAVCSGRNPSSFIVQAKGGLSEEHIKNECKSLGVSESRYRFINLGKLADFIGDMSAGALKLALAAASIAVLHHMYLFLKKKIKVFQEQLKHHYLSELLRNNRKDAVKAALLLLAVLLLFGLLLKLSIGFIGYVLEAGDLISIMGYEPFSSFYRYFNSLRQHFLFAVLLLGGFLINTLLLLYMHLQKNSD
ncbi:ABC transporter permease [Sinanaerobacter chloroacetimidivorans]|uniref:ABC transporter permease n=1 Tax=Sinanaerobacter chloroacetimidivorans TaxID=2818044 RepID=A0A8J7W5M9_9FIRM|nr:ABC transporter permease [Sinanaerobacter chloroacetimidivorans]MBR0599655.1 ABC transporter permease [Sinanaerobacter chloroacetimidivorans]